MTETPENSQLAALMSEAGMSRKGLARRVADVSQRRGDDLPASPDHNRVRRWVVAGEVPKPSTQWCIALALQDKLGRRITPADAGFPDGGDGAVDLVEEGASYPEDVSDSLSLLTSLSRADEHDQPLGSDWKPDATSSIITEYLLGQSLVVPALPTSSGGSLAAPIRDTTASFMQLDFQYGGGYMRALLLNFFKANVVPLLNQRHPENERRDLFSAAAEVAQLLGWTSYDAGRHAAAQRYFIQGLRLAREGGDPMLGGRLLSNLSHQANYLGHFTDAAKYARAAQHATAGVATPAVSTLFLAHEARAMASLGDSAGCSRIIHTAETTLDRSTPGSEPAWAWYVDANEIASEWAHCFRDLGDPENAERFVNEAVQGVAPRTQAFMRMISAQSTLRSSNLDEAVATAHQAVELVGPLNSARYQRYLFDFHADLMAAYPRDERVKGFTATLRRQFPNLDLRQDGTGRK